MTVYTPAEIEKVAEEFAEMKLARAGHPLDPGLIFEVAKATAVEVIEFALPRLREDPGE